MVVGEFVSNTEYDFENSCNFYIKDFEDNAGGPQFSGLTNESFAEAWSDPESIWIELEGAEKVRWPLLVPIKYNIDYRSDFFEEHFDGRDAFYLSLPSEMSDADRLAFEDILRLKMELAQEPFIATYDFIEGERQTHYESIIGAMNSISVQDVTPVSKAFGQEYGLPKVIHFETTLINDEEKTDDTISMIESIERHKRSSPESLPQNGAAIITTEHLEAHTGQLLEEIWSMYEGQFEQLVEDHPSLQIQPKEELEKMLKDPASLNIACFDDGKIAALMYFVTNIDVCPWLKKDFYSRTSSGDNEQILYFPGIVVEADKARQGANYVSDMLSVSNEVLLDPDVAEDARITFQCTNVSATYIPKIVSDFIARSVKTRTVLPTNTEDYGVFKPTAEYQYRVVSIG